MNVQEDFKLSAIECWTADPCGSVPGTPGTARYAEDLVVQRDAYAPWMATELDYEGSAGLDVLDVGCGQGIDLISYARAGARGTGIDLTPRHVELARAHLAGLELPGTVVEGDAESLPFPAGTFDRVSSNGVLHHTPNIADALREIRRVLRPGGRTTIILYNRRSLHYWLNQVVWRGVHEGELRRKGSMAGVLSHGVEYSSIGAHPLVVVYTPREAQRLMLAAGFASSTVSVRHFRWADVPYGEVASRFSFLRGPRLLDRVGRIAGWYIVARGVKS